METIEKFNKASLENELIPFTQLPNAILQTNMDSFAFQLWAYLCSKPSNWMVIKSELCDHFKCKIRKINNAFNILYSMKLASYEQLKDENGKFLSSKICIFLGVKVIATFNTETSVDKSKNSNDCNTSHRNTSNRMPVKPADGAMHTTNKENTNKEKTKIKREPARKKRVPLSKDFEPNEKAKAFADKKGIDLLHVLNKFKEYTKSAGWRREDWDAAFMAWLIDEKDINNSKNIIQDNNINRTKPNESKCTVKFWEPGNPDYDRANGIGNVNNGTETSRNNLGRNNMHQTAGNLLSSLSLG